MYVCGNMQQYVFIFRSLLLREETYKGRKAVGHGCVVSAPVEEGVILLLSWPGRDESSHFFVTLVYNNLGYITKVMLQRFSVYSQQCPKIDLLILHLLWLLQKSEEKESELREKCKKCFFFKAGDMFTAMKNVTKKNYKLLKCLWYLITIVDQTLVNNLELKQPLNSVWYVYCFWWEVCGHSNNAGFFQCHSKYPRHQTSALWILKYCVVFLNLLNSSYANKAMVF